MKRLSAPDQELAGCLALALGDAMCKAIPVLLTQQPEAVVSVTLPVAMQLVRYERKARRSRKDARKYRRLLAEVRETLRCEDGARVTPGVLAGTVPFDPEAWHTALAPGIGSEHLEVP